MSLVAEREVDPLALVAPVSLDELNTQAALHTRVDRKYLVPVATSAGLIAAFVARMRVLTIEGRYRFGYRSVYFDTQDLGCFRAHVQQRRRRFKVRTRTYQHSGQCLLEVKTKGGRAETVKNRLPYHQTFASSLTRPGQAFIAELVPEADVASLLPSIETRYERTTLLDDSTQSRVTIDSSLSFGRSVRTAWLDPAFVLIETKSVDGAGPVDRWLWRQRVRPVSISKYGVGVAMLFPGAATNPWHRILQRHFIWG